MTQRSDSPGLVAESLQERRVRSELGMQHLDRHPTLQRFIERLEHRGRRSAADPSQQSVAVAELSADADSVGMARG